MAGHARGADPGQGGEQFQAVHPAGRRDRQHGTGEPCTTPGLRAGTPLAPHDGRPDGGCGCLAALPLVRIPVMDPLYP